MSDRRFWNGTEWVDGPLTMSDIVAKLLAGQIEQHCKKIAAIEQQIDECDDEAAKLRDIRTLALSELIELRAALDARLEAGKPNGWRKVVHAAECIDQFGDGESLICPVCKSDYAACPCPGPHQSDEWEYEERSDGLYARKLYSDPEKGETTQSAETPRPDTREQARG